ncbi:conserved hypothetical protein [Chlorobium phaeobacteroides DSM 266]|uniref:SLBB domain-containing protein n=2 Tax=Chlorobium phaeobacteroides TaxID=1096 RepID=A1BJQ7_CHLPD|nr:conserved hypothetical protein [Chlorobium phaeobacteroides DSM 266]
MLALIERTRYQQAMRFTKILTVALLSLQCMAFFGMSGKAEAAQYGTSDISAQLFSGEQQQTTRQVYNPLAGPQYPIIQDSYFTDDYGNILMIVNVLGEVNKQGQLVVRENVDFATILALAGGIKQEANLKKVVVARQNPEKNGIQAYTIDIKKYYKHGDRSSFIALKPNDTIIIPEKAISLTKIARVMSIIYPWVSIYNIIQSN